MRGLPLISLFALIFLIPTTDSPHEKDLKNSCNECHTSDSWKIDMKSITFNHNSTKFLLEGAHQDVNCKNCHESLIFSEAEPVCMSCHTDIHEQSVGSECNRCHGTNSWIVTNITEIHQMSRFPLLGAHSTADCFACHETSSNLVFEPLDVACYSCHQNEFLATTKPNHISSGYSTDCSECHQINAFSWTGVNFTHAFFPLNEGHDIRECSRCHTDLTNYSNISSDCIDCHQEDYNNATSPNHVASNFPTDCKICHTLAPGWKPADFSNHDALFPIYSGEHKGEWDNCTDCHNVPGNYAIFTCISCHEHNQSEMNNEHDDVGGYSYNSNACFECHPTGDGDKVFDHNTSNFPLTGAHTATLCADCHTSGYSGTASDCSACHTDDFNQSVNPNHVSADLSTNCTECHTTAPDWKPANFQVHDNLYFPIYSGEHNAEWSECVECHTNLDNYTIFTCTDCHDHNQADTDSEHEGLAGYEYNSNYCLDCHPRGDGEGAFDHSLSNFPLTGAHITTGCAECHTNGYSGTPTYCAECHTTDYNNSTNPNHQQAAISDDCIQCHTTAAGWTPAGFDHANSGFPMTGGHETATCASCHTNGYTGTPSYCAECHITDYNNSTNPNHQQASISDDCVQCHTTAAGWTPAGFDHASSGFPMTGGHETATCASCHTNGYSQTSANCFDCHEVDFNQTINPNHLSLSIDNSCAECHTTQPGWQPATFNTHNNYYVLAGAHQNIANDCATCHNGDYNNTPNTCYACHTADYNQTNNPPHASAQFSTDCVICHTQNAWAPSTFNHDAQYFPIYSGKHNNEWNTCSECHTNPNDYALFSCIDCHEHNQTSMNNEHNDVNGYSWNSIACLDCHPDGSDKKFIHNQNQINIR